MPRILLTTATLVVLTTRTLTSQVLEGIVVDDLTTGPLAGALVVLLDSAGGEAMRSITDTTGAFAFDLARPGRFSLWTSQFGYEQVFSPLLAVGPATVSVEIRMSPSPAELEAIEVTAEAQYRALEAVGFYRRQEVGIGRFVTAREIEVQRPTKVSDALRTQPSVPAIRDAGGDGGTGTVITFPGLMSGFGDGDLRPCLPTLVLDGVKVRGSGPLPGAHADVPRPVRLDGLVHPSEIAAIELYPTASGVPPRFGGMDAGCGVILVWTRLARP